MTLRGSELFQFSYRVLEGDHLTFTRSGVVLGVAAIRGEPLLAPAWGIARAAVDDPVPNFEWELAVDTCSVGGRRGRRGCRRSW